MLPLDHHDLHDDDDYDDDDDDDDKSLRCRVHSRRELWVCVVVGPTVEDESQFEWPCYECKERFRTSAELQNHLDSHDTEVEPIPTSSADAENYSENLRRGQRRKLQTPAATDDATNVRQMVSWYLACVVCLCHRPV